MLTDSAEGGVDTARTPGSRRVHDRIQRLTRSGPAVMAAEDLKGTGYVLAMELKPRDLMKAMRILAVALDQRRSERIAPPVSRGCSRALSGALGQRRLP